MRGKEDPHAEGKNESPNLHKNMIIQTVILYDRLNLHRRTKTIIPDRISVRNKPIKIL